MSKHKELGLLLDFDESASAKLLRVMIYDENVPVLVSGKFDVDLKVREVIQRFLAQQSGQLPKTSPVYRLSFSALYVTVEDAEGKTWQTGRGEICDAMNSEDRVYFTGTISGIEATDGVGYSLINLLKK
jgi:hypothetical protein